jgi:hypothetical protein
MGFMVANKSNNSIAEGWLIKDYDEGVSCAIIPQMGQQMGCARSSITIQQMLSIIAQQYEGLDDQKM